MFPESESWTSTFTATLGDYRCTIDVLHGLSKEANIGVDDLLHEDSWRSIDGGLGAKSPNKSAVVGSPVYQHDKSMERMNQGTPKIVELIDDDNLQIRRRPVDCKDNWAVYVSQAFPTEGVHHHYTSKQNLIMQ